MRRALLLGALWILALGACVPGGRAARSTPAFGVALDGQPVTSAMIDAARASTGLPVRLVEFYAQWPDNPAGSVEASVADLGASLNAIRAAGAVPCVTWEPMSIGAGGTETVIPAQRILSGEYDAYIAAWARAVRGYGLPVLLRLAHEMNLERYHWGTDAAGYGPNSPELYKALFRRVVEVFRAQGANNALFVFCPNVDSIPVAAWNKPGAYYPGDAYVQVLGMDGYNWGTTHTKAAHGYDSSFRSFAEIFRPLHDELRALAPTKPVMVFETASASAGGDKARWAAEAYGTAADWGLWAVVWFEVDKEQDWPLRKNAKDDPAPGVRPHVTDDPAWLDKLLGARP
ncbi:MAG: glycosyl hydrolase [Humidesulfovibrio sp.]|uniref:glycoside hydrolase family 26 protein n=1 Tax=Humidesulfovibrio sp. TaxID=2910988 RepID=UPI002734387E|nr:glycosyl hydrolase [Humidesulfovibrio sp.]MDP2849413.1 glycosyl hydrolase [Humidesulfovibrio sp.]